MCTKPLTIKNPYYGCDPRKGVNYLHDCTNSYILVPCNQCPECYRMRQQRITQRWHIESLVSDLFYFTLTYAPRCLTPIATPAGDFFAPNIADVQKMFKRLRKSNAFGEPFKYFVVSEYGGNRHRPHYHGVIALPKHQTCNPTDDLIFNELRGRKYHDIVLNEWRRNVGSSRKPLWIPCCDFIHRLDGKRTFDFHYLNPRKTADSEGDVAFYVSKYVLKYDSYVDIFMKMLRATCDTDEEYLYYKTLFRPSCYVSKSFGRPDAEVQRRHIRQGITYALRLDSPFPFFINPVNGASFPLSPYYRRKCFTYKDAMDFHFFSSRDTLDSHVDSTLSAHEFNQDRQLKINELRKFEKIRHGLEIEFFQDDENFLDIF